MSEEKKYNVDLTEEEEKQLKRVKVAYPVLQFGGGIEKSFYSTYSSYFYTNVYMLSTVYSGVLTIVSTIFGWVGTPLFGGIIDKVKFKSGRYWPWLIIGACIYNLSWLGIYALPMLGVAGAGAGIVCLVLACIAQIGSPLMTVATNGSFPLLSNDPADRQFFAKAQKVGRDGAKTLFGYIFPALLPILIAKSSEATAYGSLVFLAAVPPIIAYTYYAMVIKGSYVERRADDKPATAGKAKKSISLLTMLKTVFTNRPLLAMYLFMSLHKIYYFIYVTCASYMFKYIFADFGKMKYFMTVFNLTAIIGVMFGPLWKAIFKETKRCFVAGMAVHVAIMVVIAVFFHSLSTMAFIGLFAVSSLFMGLLENYILPMFAAAADYGAWKAGSRLDGISMSIYSLTIKTGTLFAATIRTAILAAAGLDVIKGYATIAEMPQDAYSYFVEKASVLYSWIPVGLGVAALLVLMFLFNLNDDKITKINADLAAGKTAADSEYKF